MPTIVRALAPAEEGDIPLADFLVNREGTCLHISFYPHVYTHRPLPPHVNEQLYDALIICVLELRNCAAFSRRLDVS